jgi:hypothetical protein
MHRREGRPSAVTVRSQLVLEIAAGISALPHQRMRQAKVLLREQGTDAWPLCLFASSTLEGVEAVVSGEAALAILNPSAALTLAYRGMGRYPTPQPIRAVTVIPSLDQYMFAVRREVGLRSLDDIARLRYPLRISLRGQPDHYLHEMLDHIALASGFRLSDIVEWGGDIRREEFVPPRPGGKQLAAVIRGDLDAIFDEGVGGWIDGAIDAGMQIVPVSDVALATLERMGYRRNLIRKSVFPRLPGDVQTLDFSGWPVFVHAEAPDQLVADICTALDQRKDFIAWEGEGPLPVERMCRDTEDTPLDVPLHPAAERYWRQRGYLD